MTLPFAVLCCFVRKSVRRFCKETSIFSRLLFFYSFFGNFKGRAFLIVGVRIPISTIQKLYKEVYHGRKN
jgi:hypothetical protein